MDLSSTSGVVGKISKSFPSVPPKFPSPEENRDCDEIQDVEIHARPWLSFASLSMHILATYTGDGENGTHVKPIPPSNVHHQTNFTNYIQRYSSSLSRGFKDEDWGIPLASGLVTVATYCLCRTSLLLATTVTKNCDRLDEWRCINARLQFCDNVLKTQKSHPDLTLSLTCLIISRAHSRPLPSPFSLARSYNISAVRVRHVVRNVMKRSGVAENEQGERRPRSLPSRIHPKIAMHPLPSFP